MDIYICIHRLNPHTPSSTDRLAHYILNPTSYIDTSIDIEIYTYVVTDFFVILYVGTGSGIVTYKVTDPLIGIDHLARP